ncbi:MAG: MFS transporter [Aliifodinibius sp.]|nr:MFS transporter [Fodinibius sp.]
MKKELDRKKQDSVVGEYISNLRAFKQNARLYLLSVLITGMTMGGFRLLFNFFVLSLGFDEELLGNLITTSNTTALLMALPMGYLVDLWGRKNSLIIRTLFLGLAVAVMAVWPSAPIFFAMNILIGLAMSIGSVVTGPFMMENSEEKERSYLFSFSSGIRMAAMSVGNWVGGYLPTWVGGYENVDPESSTAYAGTMLILALVSVIGLIPIFFVKRNRLAKVREGVFSPIVFARENPKLLGKFFTPLLIVSIGAGLFVPFMNVFFREVHYLPDTTVGSLMAWGSLAMGVGLLIAPPLADRLGKLRLVVISQGLSIPFMILLGFSPIVWIGAAAFYFRMALMNMSSPIYQNFILEKVKPDERATVASLHSMVWSFGRSFSPSVSGSLQVNYGFGPPFLIAICLYAVAIFLYWMFWLRKSSPIEQPSHVS